MSSLVLGFSVVKVPILQHLENLRDEELEERREKRRRQLAEEEETAKQNESSAAGEETREQSLQVKEKGMNKVRKYVCSVVYRLYCRQVLLL